MDTVDNDDDRHKPASNPEPVAGPIPVIKVPEATARKAKSRPVAAPAARREPPVETASLSLPGTGGLRSTKPKPPPATTSVVRLAKAAARKTVPSQGAGSSGPRQGTGAPAAPRPGVPGRPGKPRARKTAPRQHSQNAAQRADSSSAAARRMLRRLVQGETPPTQAMSIVERLAGSPYANPRVRSGGPDASARKTLDLALSMAETMFRYGAGALEVETAMIAVTAAYGLDNIEVDITNQSVLLNYSPKDQTPITVMRVVRSWTNNYAGLALVHRLVTDIVDGNVSRPEAAQQLNAIVHQPKPFPRWAVTFSAGLFAAAIVAFIGSGPLGSAVAFFSTILVSLLQRLLGRWRVPDFFTTAASGFLVTALAMLFWALDATDSLDLNIAPGIVVAGGILLLLPTGRLVSAVQDAINGFPVTAAGRFLSAFLTFAAIVAGIAVALVMGALVGMPRLEVTEVASSQYPFAVTVLILAVALATISITEQSPMNLILPTVLIGVGGFLVGSLSEAVGVGPRLTPAVAAIAIGMAARIVALRMGAPQLVIAVPAVLFLFPGLSIFRSMYGLSIGLDDVSGGVIGLFNALTVILAIAGGVVFGDNLARPLTRNLNGNDRRNRRR
nr:threonine/serine exporter family protein [Arthrobacter gallicola]